MSPVLLYGNIRFITIRLRYVLLQTLSTTHGAFKKF